MKIIELLEKSLEESKIRFKLHYIDMGFTVVGEISDEDLDIITQPGVPRKNDLGVIESSQVIIIIHRYTGMACVYHDTFSYIAHIKELRTHGVGIGGWVPGLQEFTEIRGCS